MRGGGETTKILVSRNARGENRQLKNRVRYSYAARGRLPVPTIIQYTYRSYKHTHYIIQPTGRLRSEFRTDIPIGYRFLFSTHADPVSGSNTFDRAVNRSSWRYWFGVARPPRYLDLDALDTFYYCCTNIDYYCRNSFRQPLSTRSRDVCGGAVSAKLAE